MEVETDGRLPTGEWDGFYLESHHSRRGWMHLYLCFESGRVKGEGTDYVGPWTATGSYDTETGICQWCKEYVGKHCVDYFGQITKRGILGEWKLGFRAGPFHIWPRGMSEFNELYLQNELNVPFEPVRPSGSPLQEVGEEELATIR